MSNERTPEEEEIRIFGMTNPQLRLLVETSPTPAASIVISMGSDAQHEIEVGHAEDARQTINRMKWIVSEYLTTRDEQGRAIKAAS